MVLLNLNQLKRKKKQQKPEIVQESEPNEQPEIPTEDVSDIFKKIDNTLARKPKGRIV
jgi:hypothetical protein